LRKLVSEAILLNKPSQAHVSLSVCVHVYAHFCIEFVVLRNMLNVMNILNWIITLYRFTLFYISVVSYMFIIMRGSVKEYLKFLSSSHSLFIVCLFIVYLWK
jgi:hypothetical protein